MDEVLEEEVLTPVIEGPLEVIVIKDVDRPFMTTPFEEYTVSEGLLLLILLAVFVMWCVKIVKGGFYWL